MIATGGSVIYGKEAMAHLGENGTVVYLKLPYEAIKKRLGDLNERGGTVKEGQTLSVVFKITDNDGVMYTYLAEQLDVTKDGLEERQPKGWGMELLKNGWLTME